MGKSQLYRPGRENSGTRRRCGHHTKTKTHNTNWQGYLVTVHNKWVHYNMFSSFSVTILCSTGHTTRNIFDMQELSHVLYTFCTNPMKNRSFNQEHFLMCRKCNMFCTFSVPTLYKSMCSVHACMPHVHNHAVSDRVGGESKSVESHSYKVTDCSPLLVAWLQS